MSETNCWSQYHEQQLAAAGFAIMDLTIARALRPSLWPERGVGAVRDDGSTAAFERLMAEARENGRLYDATIRVSDQTREQLPRTCVSRRYEVGDERVVQIVALDASRLSERLRWLGLDVVSVQPVAAAEEQPEPSPEEVAKREAEAAARRAAMGLYGGHPARPPAG